MQGAATLRSARQRPLRNTWSCCSFVSDRGELRLTPGTSKQELDLGGRGDGSLAQSGSRSRIAAIVSVDWGQRMFLSRQHLEQHAAERPDVGAFVDLLSTGLLRAHVRCCAEQDAFARLVHDHRREIPLALICLLRQTEVEDLDDTRLTPGWLNEPGVRATRLISNNETELLSTNQLAFDRSLHIRSRTAR